MGCALGRLSALLPEQRLLFSTPSLVLGREDSSLLLSTASQGLSRGYLESSGFRVKADEVNREGRQQGQWDRTEGRGASRWVGSRPTSSWWLPQRGLGVTRPLEFPRKAENLDFFLNVKFAST